MNNHEFERIIDELTSRQRQVLKPFLLGESDEAIARSLHVEAATVRRHLANICKQFELHNAAGEHYSYRDELLLLIARYKPEWIKHPIAGQRSFVSELPGEPIKLNSPIYVPRPPIESQCQTALTQAGALIRIRAPHRMGKTSLLNRVFAYAKDLGYQSVRLNLGQVEPSILSQLDPFLKWVCLNLSQKLGLPTALSDYWDPQFGSLISCTTYVQALLQNLNTNLVLGIDEVDWLLETPDTARGFFALLRSWHEEANNLAVWQKLRLVVVHSTEVYIPLNLHQSPFNVGLSLRLPPLTFEQIVGLAHIYRLKVSEDHLRTLYVLVGGHPYLIQLALYHLQHDDMSLATLLETAATQSGIYSHDLRRLWQAITVRADLTQALQQVMDSAAILNPTPAYQLESMGLIRLQGNQASLSCELYRQYFQSLL